MDDGLILVSYERDVTGEMDLIDRCSEQKTTNYHDKIKKMIKRSRFRPISVTAELSLLANQERRQCF